MIVSEPVYSVLAPMVRQYRRRSSGSQSGLKILATRLRFAAVLPPDEVPAGTVSLGAPVRLYEMGCRTSCTCRIVLPSEASAQRDMISVFSSVGAALLGASEGDTVLCRTPTRLLLLRIDKAGEGSR